MHNGMRSLLAVGVLLGTIAVAPAGEKVEPPKVGEEARDFSLKVLDDETVQLSKLTKRGPVVLLVLRGYPGYQCPICNRQVGEYLGKAKAFKQAGANVLLVYPGPADKLKEHAEDFIRGKTLPDNFTMLIDPDYTFTNKWALRWDAPRETAYPSTFIIDTSNTIRHATISKTHGGRTKAADILKELSAVK